MKRKICEFHFAGSYTTATLTFIAENYTQVLRQYARISQFGGRLFHLLNHPLNVRPSVARGLGDDIDSSPIFTYCLKNHFEWVIAASVDPMHRAVLTLLISCLLSAEYSLNICIALSVAIVYRVFFGVWVCARASSPVLIKLSRCNCKLFDGKVH